MRQSPLVHASAFDNGARVYRHIEARPLAAAMGAEIVGLDPAAMSEAAATELKDALWRHKMVFMRGTPMDDAQQLAFTRRLGPPAHDPFAGASDPDLVIAITKAADERQAIVFGGGWHTDSPFLERPPAITILRAVEVPPFGGDTIWADAGLAFRTLSPAFQRLVAPLRVRMAAQKALDLRASLGSNPKGIVQDDARAKAVEGRLQPLVRTHPETGEKALYLSGGYALGVDGLTEAEGQMLIDFLMSHITRNAFTCRLRWEAGTLALWDNRLCQHMAMNDYDGHRRSMRRSMVLGEVPA
jgi:taurine dioxygenase